MKIILQFIFSFVVGCVVGQIVGVEMQHPVLAALLCLPLGISIGLITNHVWKQRPRRPE